MSVGTTPSRPLSYATPRAEVIPTRSPMGKIAYFTALILLSMAMMMPLLFMVNTSLKTLGETYADPPRFWPEHVQWDNYRNAFTTFPFVKYLSNTLFLTAMRVSGVLITCTLVAWGFARYKGRYTNILFMLCLSTMMLPPQVTSIPVFTMFVKLGFYNTYVPLVMGAWLGQNAFFIFLLKQFFEAIPEDLLNAARIDGCGEFGSLLHVGLPLSKPILWTMAVFTFLGSWNDYFGPLIYLVDEQKYPLSLGLTYFLTASKDASLGTQWNLMLAVSMVTMLPVGVLFFIAQRSFVDNALSGGLKI